MRKLLLFCLFTVLVSCNKTDIYSKFDKDFPDNRWSRTDVKTYDFEILDETKSYDLILKFRHLFDYQFMSVPLNFKITDPSGKEEKFTIDLKIKDSSGHEIGGCIGDICDLDHKIKENTKLAKGKYTITVSHSFPHQYLPNVLGIGLDVTTVK